MDTVRNLKNNLTLALIIMLMLAILLNMSACSAPAVKVIARDLMDGISPGDVSSREPDERFVSSTAGFVIDLFKIQLLRMKTLSFYPCQSSLLLL